MSKTLKEKFVVDRMDEPPAFRGQSVSVARTDDGLMREGRASGVGVEEDDRIHEVKAALGVLVKHLTQGNPAPIELAKHLAPTETIRNLNTRRMLEMMICSLTLEPDSHLRVFFKV